jgi:hypothetical protein
VDAQDRRVGVGGRARLRLREAAEGQEPFVGGPWDFGLRLGVVLVSVLILVEWIALREHGETATRLRRAWPVVDPPPAKPEPDPGETS